MSKSKTISMFQLFRHMLSSSKNVFEEFFSNDMDVISSDTKKIMSNSEDRKKYVDAINQLIEEKSNLEKVGTSMRSTTAGVSKKTLSKKIILSDKSEVELTL